ncbi:hypothetical protein TEA_008479 [Camellia sinensis var. sinensis]|uniref:Fungal lipase-type domain-containing protein n=1 Tax=Camellia sinensis var. sinensis TaxID=542762 RepID=A0A4S4DUR8_CAMSN|nr:hypothetical protein TEA_008479 [Camellia sinensis var. sinensis]
MKEVKRLVKFLKTRGEQVSLTITGHSLRGALALLNAYEAATAIPNLHISVISFGAPRVGNITFRDEIHQMGVKTLRVVVKQDLIPRMPGIVFNESLQMFDDFTGTLDWRGGFNVLGFHMLETYLHLVDGFMSTSWTFRLNARRDVALVNKACDMLVDELRIPPCWYQMENKGLVYNDHGRWVKPRSDPEDIPSPTREEVHDHAIHDMEESYKALGPLLSV